MSTEVHIEIELTEDGQDIKTVSYEVDEGFPPMHEPDGPDVWCPGWDVESDPLYKLAADEGSDVFIGTARARQIWAEIMVKKYGFPQVESWAIEPEEHL